MPADSIALPPGATLLDPGSMKLPPGATLVQGDNQPSAAARFGTGVYENSPVGGIVSLATHKPQDTAEAMASGLLGLPELKSIAALAGNGHLPEAAILTAHWLGSAQDRATGLASAHEDFQQGNAAGGAGRLVGSAITAGLGAAGENLPAAADAVTDAVKKPGTGKIVIGTGQTVSALPTLLSGHPIVAGGLLLRGINNLWKGFGERGATPPPAESVPPGIDPAAFAKLDDVEKAFIRKSADPAYLQYVADSFKPQPRPTVLSQPPEASAGNPSAADMLAQELAARRQSPISIDTGKPVVSTEPASPAGNTIPSGPIDHAQLQQLFERVKAAADEAEAAKRPVPKIKPIAAAPPQESAPAAAPPTNGNGAGETPANLNGKVEGAPIGRTQEYQAMLKNGNWTVDPSTFPGAKPGDPKSAMFRPGATVAPKMIRSFPESQLEALGKAQGITADQALAKLKGDGWLVLAAK